MPANLVNAAHKKGVVKRLVSLRLDKDVIEGFRAKGSGWQTQINDALRDWLSAHPR